MEFDNKECDIFHEKIIYSSLFFGEIGLDNGVHFTLRLPDLAVFLT